MRKKVLFLVLVYFLFCGVCQATENSDLNIKQFEQELEQASTKQGVIQGKVNVLNTKYLLSPGDNIAVSVYGETDFAQPSILIRPDGTVTVEPFGELQAAGLSIGELTDELTFRYKGIIKEPRVSVKLNGLKAAKVYIYGAVNKPGLYEQVDTVSNTNFDGSRATTTPDLTVASVIARCGGITHNADIQRILISNKSTGKEMEINLLKMIKEGDSTQDNYLSNGDSIYIPIMNTDAQIPDEDFLLLASSSLAPENFPIRVVGAVNKPGIYQITTKNPGVNSAIASAEGFTLDANKIAVKVQRVTPKGNLSTFYVNPQQDDLMLRPNDLIYVSDTTSAIAGRGFEYMTRVITPFRWFADSYNSWAEMFEPGRRYNRYY